MIGQTIVAVIGYGLTTTLVGLSATAAISSFEKHRGEVDEVYRALMGLVALGFFVMALVSASITHMVSGV